MPFLLLGTALISFAPVIVMASGLHADLIAFYRLIFGIVWLLGLLLWSRPLGDKKFFRPIALLAGIAFATDLFCWHRSIIYLGPGLATLLVNLQVLLVAAYGMISKQELPRKSFWLAAPLALMGLALIVSGSTLPRQQVLPGVLLGLGAALAYSTFLVLLRQIERQPDIDSRNTILQVSLSAAVLSGLASIVQGKALLIPDTRALLYLMAYGFVIQGLAWTLIARGFKKVPGWQASIILLLQPILALCWDVLLFQRTLNPIEIMGLGLTLFAIYLSLQPGFSFKWPASKARA